MAKSKIVSFRVPYESYAEILIKCSKSNIDISDHARERFFYDSEQAEKEQARLSKELESCMVSLEQSMSDFSKKSERVQELEKEQARLSKELELCMVSFEQLMSDYSKNSELVQGLEKEQARLSKELETSKSEKLTQLEQFKKESAKDKAEIKRLTDDFKNLGTSAAEEVESLKNDLKNALERIKKANAYCVANGVGTTLGLGIGEAIQF